jgi:protein gp37
MKKGNQWWDKSWNPISGCTPRQSGCANCWAKEMAKRFWGGRKFTDVQCHEDRLKIPLHWKKPRKIFVCSMSDLFHEKVPFRFIHCVHVIMSRCVRKGHIFQLLTKRIDRALEFYEYEQKAKRTEVDYVEWPMSNTWLGVSVSTQADADKNIPILLQIPAAVQFVSVEPLLEKIDLKLVDTGAMIGWVIIGSESGPKRRPCKLEWIRDIVGQCKEARVPVFIKQISLPGCRKCRFAPCTHLHGHRQIDIVSKNPAEWPKDLRVQEYPKRKIGS